MRKQLHLIPIHGRMLPAHIVPLKKGKAYAIGYVSHRKDGDYRKVAKNKWVRIRKPSEQEPQNEAEVKRNTFIQVGGPEGATHLTNLPEWAFGGVYQLGGHTFVATRKYKTMKGGEALLSGAWTFTEITTGLNVSGSVPATTPEQAKKDAEKKLYEYANKFGTTIQESLDRVISKAREKSPEDPVIFTGPYLKGMGDKDWMQLATDVAKAYGDEESPNWIDVKNQVSNYYDEVVVGGGYASPHGAELWFVKNRDNLPDELYDFIRLRTGKQELAKNIWEMAKIQPTWTQEVYAKYDTNETEILDVISNYLLDRMTTKKWGKGEWRDLIEDIDLDEMKPRGGLEMTAILGHLNEVFENKLTTYEQEEEYRYYDDPYDTLPDSIHFDTDGWWTNRELYDLGAWVTGAVRNPRNAVKNRDSKRRENPDARADPEVEDDIAYVIMEKMQRHPDVQKLFRGTTNSAWKEAQPGDILEVGIASFTHDEGIAKREFGSGSEGAVLVIDRENYDGGGFLGVDIYNMLLEMKDGATPEEARLIDSSQVNAHERESEFILRAPRLEVLGVEERDYGPPHVHVRLVDADLLEKAIWNASRDYDRIARMERTFDYHLADEPEEWE
jgi:hypothetical protein